MAYINYHELMEDKYVRAYRREDNRNSRFRNTTWNNSRRLIVTTAILYQLNAPHRAAEQLNTGYVEINNENITLNYNMDDLKLMGKPEEEIQKEM